MNLKPLILLTAALFLGAGPAHAKLPEGSPLRIRDCVPTDDVSLRNMKALRDRVRDAFARQGGAASTGPWTDSWRWGLERTDDWVTISGDAGIMGLDTKTANMSALIPRGWTKAAGAEGGYDPIADMEAARALLSGWVEKSVAGISFLHPPDWAIWVSSPSDLGAGRRPVARFEYDNYAGTPLWLWISTSAASGDEDKWFEAGIGYAVLGGDSVLGHGGASANGRYCRAVYLEREGWADPNDGGSRFVATTQLGCTNSGYTHLRDDIHAVIKTAEYSVSGAPDADALRAYDLGWRSLCTVRMALQPLRP